MTKNKAFLDTHSKKNQHGIGAIVNQNATTSYEKFPMVQVIAERLRILMNNGFRNITSEVLELDISSCESIRFGNLPKKIPGKDILVVFKIIELDSYGLLTIDSEVVFSLLDSILGGKPDNYNNIKKEYTMIEFSLIENFANNILRELEEAFEVVTNLECLLERIETNQNFVSIARPGDPVVNIEITTNIDSNIGKISVVLPYSTIEDIKPQLQQMFIGQKNHPQEEWQDKLSDKVHKVSFDLDARLFSKNKQTFGAIAKLKKGDTIMLGCDYESDAALICAGKRICTGSVGQVNGNVAIEIKKIICNNNDVS